MDKNNTNNNNNNNNNNDINTDNNNNKQNSDTTQNSKSNSKEKESEYDNLAFSNTNTNNINHNKTNLLTSKHKLNSLWCFWYASRKIKDHETPYSDRLKKFAEIDSVEDFFRYYMCLKSASEIERNTDISLFKNGYQPLWESCPDSACWFVRYKKNDDPYELDLKWEKLLFCLIGEQFEESSILGSTLSIRGRETIVELWFSYNKNDKVKNSLGGKLKEAIFVDKNTKLYFKDNSLSIQDKSTLKNAETYNFTKRKNTYY